MTSLRLWKPDFQSEHICKIIIENAATRAKRVAALLYFFDLSNYAFEIDGAEVVDDL